MSIFPKVPLAPGCSEDADLALSMAVAIANSAAGSELHVATVGPGNPDPAYAVTKPGFAPKGAKRGGAVRRGGGTVCRAATPR